MESSTETRCWGVAVAFVVICASWMLWRWQWSKYGNLPPGPRPLPIFGSLHLLGKHPHRSLAKLSSQYGPLMSVWMGQRLCIVASTAEAAKEFLKLQDANFAFRPLLRSAEIVLPEDIALHDMTPEIRHLRKIVVSELISTRRLEFSRHIRMEEMASTLCRIAGETGPTLVNAHLTVMTTNVLSRMIFNKRFLGVEEQDDGSKMIQELREIIDQHNVVFSAIYIGDYFNVPKWFDPQGLQKQYWKVRSRMDQLYAKMIDEYKLEQGKHPASEGKKTLLDIFWEQLEFPENGVTHEHIRGVIVDLISAGTETTVLTMEWAMAEVLHNPRLLSNARSELDRVVGPNRLVQESDLPDLPYIHAIVKETLRLHAGLPLLIPHQCKAPTRAFGYDIPAQTRVLVNVWAIARDNWEKPLEFLPERFLEEGSNATTEFHGQYYDFLPFGSGRRQCPGMGLGSMAVQLQVASLLHAFDWKAEGLVMDEGPMEFTLRMKQPLVATAKPRLQPHLYQGQA